MPLIIFNLRYSVLRKDIRKIELYYLFNLHPEIISNLLFCPRILNRSLKVMVCFSACSGKRIIQLTKGHQPDELIMHTRNRNINYTFELV